MKRIAWLLVGALITAAGFSLSQYSQPRLEHSGRRIDKTALQRHWDNGTYEHDTAPAETTDVNLDAAESTTTTGPASTTAPVAPAPTPASTPDRKPPAAPPANVWPKLWGLSVNQSARKMHAPNQSLGVQHRCWVEDAKPICAGREYHGELGLGITLPPIVDVQAGDGNTCALTVDREVWCWGWRMAPRVSAGTPVADSHAPVKVALPGPVTLLAVGLGDECAAVEVAAGAEIWCWGFGYHQERGFDPPYFAAVNQPVKMWAGRHVHAIEAGLRRVEAHVGWNDGTCGTVFWGITDEGVFVSRPVR